MEVCSYNLPEEMLQVGVEPAVEDGVGDGGGHGHQVAPDEDVVHPVRAGVE